MRLRATTDAVCGSLRMGRWPVGPTMEDMTTDTTTQPGVLGFTKMAGSSIAGRDAAPWVTDFLNAAYYRRPVESRDVDDLRLAFCILTTYWYRTSRGRLRLSDLRAFHRAFGSGRFDTAQPARPLLSREHLFEGAGRLLGDCFAGASLDDDRR